MRRGSTFLCLLVSLILFLLTPCMSCPSSQLSLQPAVIPCSHEYPQLAGKADFEANNIKTHTMKDISTTLSKAAEIFSLSFGMLLKNRFICMITVCSSSIYPIYCIYHRAQFCIQGQILPAPLWAPRESRTNSQWGPLYMWDMLCKRAGQTQQPPTLHHVLYVAAGFVRSLCKEEARRGTLLRCPGPSPSASS